MTVFMLLFRIVSVIIISEVFNVYLQLTNFFFVISFKKHIILLLLY